MISLWFTSSSLMFAPFIKCRLAVDVLSHEHEVEVTKLRELITDMKCGNFSGLTEIRQELEAKHAKEMEELCQYFEQKCADVEKQ